MNRSSLLLALLAICVALAGSWFLLWPVPALPADPLAVVPADASAVLSVRVARVLDSPAWQRLVVARGQARGIQRAIATCGFNPLAGIQQLTAFARFMPGEDKPRIAFAARGQLDQPRLIDCARKLSGSRGLAFEREQIEGIPGVRSKNGGTRVAFVASDGIVGGDAQGVHAALLAMLGKQPSLARDATLRALYAELSSGHELTLVARDLQRFSALFGRRLGPAFDPEALGLGEIKALGAQLALKGELISGSAQLLTSDAASAARSAQLASSARARLLDIPGIGLTGLSAPLRAARIEARGPRTTLAGELKLRSAEALLDLLELL